MSRSITEFTQSLIESKKSQVNKTKLTESKKLIEAEEIPEEEFEEEVDDAPEEKPIEREDTFENGDDFEESDTNDVYFCAKCQKHFLATEDTPENEIECPVCGEKDLIVDLGSAKDALDREENEDIAVELEDEDIYEEPEMEEENEIPEDEFEEDGLEEALNIMAQKYLNEKARIRIRTASADKDGKLVLEGRIIPLKKDIKIVLEGFNKNRAHDKFILEGTTDAFKVGKLKVAFLKEGNVYKVKKVGYGILTESMKYPVTGIIG